MFNPYEMHLQYWLHLSNWTKNKWYIRYSKNYLQYWLLSRQFGSFENQTLHTSDDINLQMVIFMLIFLFKFQFQNFEEDIKGHMCSLKKQLYRSFKSIKYMNFIVTLWIHFLFVSLNYIDLLNQTTNSHICRFGEAFLLDASKSCELGICE